MNSRITMFSEESQTKRNMHCMILSIENCLKCKLICTDRKQISGCWGWWVKEGRRNYKEVQGVIGGDGSIHYLDLVMVSQAIDKSKLIRL